MRRTVLLAAIDSELPDQLLPSLALDWNCGRQSRRMRMRDQLLLQRLKSLLRNQLFGYQPREHSIKQYHLVRLSDELGFRRLHKRVRHQLLGSS